jgi:P27 family predicted phage terminase small subunit
MATSSPSASRGRKQYPRGLKLLQGVAPGRDSGGRVVPPEVPFVRGPLEKPADLSKDASWLWDRVIEHMETIGLLKPLDAASLKIMCERYALLCAAIRRRQADGLTVVTGRGETMAPWVRVENDVSRDFRSWCAEYGLTPAAEKNLSAPTDSGVVGGETNPFA